MIRFLLNLWAEPRPDSIPPRSRLDHLIVGVALTGAAVEAVLRPDLAWRWILLAATIPMLVLLLWRRERPTLVAVGIISSVLTLEVAGEIAGVEFEGLFTAAFILLMPYAVARWGSGMDIEKVGALMVAHYVAIVILDYTSVGEIIGGAIAYALPLMIGLIVRYRHNAQVRAVDQARMREREDLARELHDTVAHHVSAILIQAQAGLAVSGSRPDQAVATLSVVEREATRTLTEMRTMIGALRRDHDAELNPQRGIDDIRRLGDAVTPGGPIIDVQFTGDLDDVAPTVQATLYRLAQESITNAVRHARRATTIAVRLVGGQEAIHLTVSDDGDITGHGPAPSGYGLAGMEERANLLGGTFDAGPDPGRGWTVKATIPRPRPLP